MKRKILAIAIGLFAVAFCGGCSGQKEKQKEQKYMNIQDNDAIYAEDLIGYDMASGLCQTESGYYFFSNTSRINYIDRESMEATPLCFDPDCSHPMDESCQAYFRDCVNIQIYQGKLYADRREYEEDYAGELKVCLYEMDLDGSNRRMVRELYDSQVIGTYGDEFDVDWRIIEGNLYVMGSYATGARKCLAYMDCYSGNGWKDKERILEWDHSGDNVDSSGLGAYYFDASDGNLYCTRYDWKEEYDEDTGRYNIGSNRYAEVENLQEKTSKKICEGIEDINAVSCCNQVYYFSEGGIYYYDKNSGESEKMVRLDDAFEHSTFWADRNYLYVNNSPMLLREEGAGLEEVTLQIYDTKGKLVDTMRMPVSSSCIPMDGEDKQFYLMADLSGDMYYMDKTKIGSGELEMIKIEGVQ